MTQISALSFTLTRCSGSPEHEAWPQALAQLLLRRQLPAPLQLLQLWPRQLLLQPVAQQLQQQQRRLQQRQQLWQQPLQRPAWPAPPLAAPQPMICSTRSVSSCTCEHRSVQTGPSQMNTAGLQLHSLCSVQHGMALVAAADKFCRLLPCPPPPPPAPPFKGGRAHPWV